MFRGPLIEGRREGSWERGERRVRREKDPQKTILIHKNQNTEKRNSNEKLLIV